MVSIHRCSLCLNDVDADKTFSLRWCGHLFHKPCILTVEEIASENNEDAECPLCKDIFEAKDVTKLYIDPFYKNDEELIDALQHRVRSAETCLKYNRKMLTWPKNTTQHLNAENYEIKTEICKLEQKAELEKNWAEKKLSVLKAKLQTAHEKISQLQLQLKDAKPQKNKVKRQSLSTSGKGIQKTKSQYNLRKRIQK